MSSVLLDTHAWAWSLTAPRKLSKPALDAIRKAGSVAISAISFYEIGQKVRLGKWPEMSGQIARLETIAEEQGVNVLAVTAGISLLASTLPWDHRDPFDRIILATALISDHVLISADAAFEAFAATEAWPGRIW